jgi:biopolymer transport protein ExbD
MAFAALGGKRGVLSAVKVIPLIGILLVLLVIFTTIPHRQMGLQTDLPQPAGPDAGLAPEVIIVQVSSDGSLRINQSVVEREELALGLERVFALRAQRVAFCKAIARSSFKRWPRFLISCIPPAPPRSAC